MPKTTFKPIRHFFILGGGALSLNAIRFLLSKKIGVTLITGERFLSERIESENRLFSEALNPLIEPISLDALSSLKNTGELASPHSFAIHFGTPDIPLDGPISNLKGRLVNFHPVLLPHYFGGAHQTWQVLQQDRRGGVCFQLCEQTWDDGPLLFEKRFNYPKNCTTPHQLFHYAKKIEEQVTRKFLTHLISGSPFKTRSLIPTNFSYFPHLNTLKNGWIDWSWTGQDILDFIRAFSNPYPGAATSNDNRVIRIRKANLKHLPTHFHPLMKGLVIRTSSTTVTVRVPEGEIELSDICDDKGDTIPPSIIRLGSRLFTSANLLEGALLHLPNYQYQTNKTTSKPLLLSTKNLLLKSLEPDNATPEYLSWLNDPEVTKFTESGNRTHTLDSIRTFIEENTASEENLFWGIFLANNGKHIGNIKLGPITSQHRRAEIGLLIGDRNEWGKGYGTEAIQAVTRFAFENLKLYKVTASISKRNGASVAAFKKSGFVEEAEKAKHLFLDGQWDSEILLAHFLKDKTT